MKVKDIIKKQTTIIAIAVVLVAATVIGVSYAIFFDVGESKGTQVITAGTLKMTISGLSTLDLSVPVSNEEGLRSTPVTYTVNNKGNLPASYIIYLYADTANEIDLSKVKISLDGTSYKALTACTVTQVGTTNYYQISEDGASIAKDATAETKSLRIWLDEDLMLDEEDGKKVDIGMYIVSEVDE